MSSMIVLGIESTCDETASAVVKNGREILSNIVASQIDLHAEYGGVVPELASRRHVDLILPVIQQSLDKANVSLQEIDLFAVAQGPGLVGALLIGLNTAKALALATNKPFVGVNHVHAHLYASVMCDHNTDIFPCLGVVLSGGHTTLLHMQSLNTYTLVSQTADDAIGEAFDKVAKLLHLPYPGGPLIEIMAAKGNPNAYPFKAGRIKERPLDFSFSGIKTSVYYAIRDKVLSEQEKWDIAASFQRAVFTDVIDKTLKAAELYGYNTLLFGGGVTNNQCLRKLFLNQAPSKRQIWPTISLTLDNAAMIAGLGYHIYQLRDGKSDAFDIEPFTCF